MESDLAVTGIVTVYSQSGSGQEEENIAEYIFSCIEAEGSKNGVRLEPSPRRSRQWVREIIL
jgi:hypothetical protein